MKRRVLIIAVILMLVFVTACGKTEDKKDDNSGNGSVEQASSSNDESTSNTEDVALYKEMYAPAAGMTIDTPKTYLENSDKVFLFYDGDVVGENLYLFGAYIYPASYEALISMNDEEFIAARDKGLNALNVFKAKEGDWTKEDVEEWCKWHLKKENIELEEIGTTKDEAGDTYTCYADVSKSQDIPEGLDEDIKTLYEGILSELDEAKNNVRHSEPEITETILSFTTKDTDGNEIKSEDIFAEAKYTMLNCWASWCGPCVMELPELEELSKEFKEMGGQIVGVLADGSSAKSLADAKEIMEEVGVTYLNIIDWEGIHDVLQLQAVPVTYFVDSNGKIVGDPVIGVNPEAYKEVMKELLG